MAKKNVIVKKGIVIEALPNYSFKVKIEKENIEAICHLSGRMRQNFIKVVPGDKVKVEFSLYDFTRGRIVYRY